MVEREEQEALEQIRNEERMIQRLQNLCQSYLHQSRKNGRKRNDLVMEYQKLNYEKKRRIEEKKGEV